MSKHLFSTVKDRASGLLVGLLLLICPQGTLATVLPPAVADTSSFTLYLGDPKDQKLFVVFEPGVLPDSETIRKIATEVLCSFLGNGPTVEIAYPIPFQVNQWIKGSQGQLYTEPVKGQGGQLDKPVCVAPAPAPKKRAPGTEA